nr:MAG: hypothetical protein [Microviridae sp.]
MTIQKGASRENAKKKDNFNFSNTSEGKELITTEQIKNTPFAIKHLTETNEYFLVLGNERVSEIYNNKEKVIEKYNSADWVLITNITAVITKTILTTQQLNNERLNEQINKKHNGN